MNRESLIKRTLQTISKLPNNKIEEISDFADFVLKRYDEEILQKGINKLVSNSKAFDFLEEEPELYSTNDLKEKF